MAKDEFPWSSDAAATACNFAFGHLARNLAAPLVVEGRLHAETFVAGAGAVAGFAAQLSLFDRTPPEAVGLMLVETSNRSRYWFGDALNFMLVPNGERDDEKLWPLAAGAAIQAGLGPDDLPSLEDMFRHVASLIGDPKEGQPSVEQEHQPHASAFALLQRTWPLAEACLTGSIAEAVPEHLKRTPRRWWSCITAYAAAKAVMDVKPVLAPRLALTILMESAIFTSKLDEAAVRQGLAAPN